MRTLLLLALFAVPLQAQVDPIRVLIPADVMLDQVTIQGDTLVSVVHVNVNVTGTDSLYRAGTEAALASLGGQPETRRRHVLIRILESRTAQNVAILGAALIVGNALRKSRTDVDVDVDVEGDEHIVVVPPHEHDHGHGKKGKGKGHKPGG